MCCATAAHSYSLAEAIELSFFSSFVWSIKFAHLTLEGEELLKSKIVLTQRDLTVLNEWMNDWMKERLRENEQLIEVWSLSVAYRSLLAVVINFRLDIRYLRWN